MTITNKSQARCKGEKKRRRENGGKWDGGEREREREREREISVESSVLTKTTLTVMLRKIVSAKQ